MLMAKLATVALIAISIYINVVRFQHMRFFSKGYQTYLKEKNRHALNSAVKYSLKNMVLMIALIMALVFQLLMVIIEEGVRRHGFGEMLFVLLVTIVGIVTFYTMVMTAVTVLAMLINTHDIETLTYRRFLLDAKSGYYNGISFVHHLVKWMSVAVITLAVISLIALNWLM